MSTRTHAAAATECRYWRDTLAAAGRIKPVNVTATLCGLVGSATVGNAGIKGAVLYESALPTGIGYTLPMALTLCLHRWELDYETWQRKKLDDRFEYPLELNMLDYLSEEAKMQYTAPEDYIYELKSIVIHRGGGYGGHYFAYIKDDLGEGTWHLD